MSTTSTATNFPVFHGVPTSRLSPAKCAFLIGIEVVLVVVCMFVVIREVVLMEESSSETTLLAESSGTKLDQPFEQSRIWAVGVSDQVPTKSLPEVDQLLSSSEKADADPDCVVEETVNTKMAKAVFVFLAGALLQSERSRSIVVAGAL